MYTKLRTYKLSTCTGMLKVIKHFWSNAFDLIFLHRISFYLHNSQEKGMIRELKTRRALEICFLHRIQIYFSVRTNRHFYQSWISKNN